MKVTENSTYRLMQTNLDRITTDLQDLRYQGATGLKLNAPSDDPSAVRPVLTTRTQISRTDRYIETMGVAADKMESTDGHLEHVENLLQRVKEIGVNAINGAMSDSDLEALADEVDQLREELLDAANAMVDGKYIFAGYQENTIPFVENPNYDADLWDEDNPNTWPYLYQGDSNPTELEITSGELIETNLTGNDLFFGISNSTIQAGIPDQPPIPGGIEQGGTMLDTGGTITIVTNGVTTVTPAMSDDGVNFALVAANAIDSTLSGNDTGVSVTVNSSETASSGDFTATTGAYSLTVNGESLVSSPASSAYQFDSQLNDFIDDQINLDATSAGGSITDGDAWFTDSNGTVIEINGSAQTGDLTFSSADGANLIVTESTSAAGEGFTTASYHNTTDTTFGTIDIGTNAPYDVDISGAGLTSVGLQAGPTTLDAATAYSPDEDRMDMFSALTRLEEALRGSNEDDPDGAGGGISQALENLELVGDQERRLRSRLGNRASRVETATSHQEDFKIDLEQVLSRYQDADAIDVFNEIVKQETAYQAALSITARVSEISILNYF